MTAKQTSADAHTCMLAALKPLTSIAQDELAGAAELNPFQPVESRKAPQPKAPKLEYQKIKLSPIKLVTLTWGRKAVSASGLVS